MKTVEERMSELKAMATGRQLIAYWRDFESQVAQHLTQQAAEWQIALNEAQRSDLETQNQLRTAQDTVVALSVQVNSYREELAKAREGEKGRIEAAVREAYEDAALSVYNSAGHQDRMGNLTTARHLRACAIRLRNKAQASPSPVSEPQKPTRYDEYGKLYAEHMERVRGHCWQTDGPREVNNWNDLSKRSESDWQHPWNQWPPSVVASDVPAAAQSRPVGMDQYTIALQVLMLPRFGEGSKLLEQLNELVIKRAILGLGGKLPVDEVK